MKLILRVFFFFAISTKLFSQTAIPTSKIIYLDSSWVESTENNYKYIRLVEEYYSEKKSYVYKDYYKSKALKAIGTSIDKDIIKPDGQFISYYENGNKKSIATFIDKKKNGKEFNWYKNGNLKSELEYFSNKKGEVESKINNYWNPQKEQTVTDGNGEYEDINDYAEEKGKIKNGFPDGVWKGKFLKSKTTFTENYENGKLIVGVSKDSLNIEHPYTTVNQPPSPQKGINSFYSYVGKSMYIPKEARNNVSGKIYLTFIVDIEGNLVEPKIIKGIGHGLDESAISVIKHAKKWNPGIRRGIPVKVLYSLPITIKTNNKT